MRLHSDITLEVLNHAVERYQRNLENPGFCIHCGAEHGQVEPDACEYLCEECGELGVYGAEELLLRVATHGVTDKDQLSIITEVH